MRIGGCTLLLGYKCNNNCIFCLYGDNKSENLSLEEIKAALKELRKFSSSVMLTGGSAYRNDYLDILKFAKELGFRIHIDTNGRIFSDENFVKKVFEIVSNPVFSISLHSSYEEIHDSITRVKGSWRQTIDGIKNVVKYGGYVIVPSVICKLNYKELPRLAKFIKELGAKEFHPILVRKEGRAEKNYSELVVKISEIMPYLLEALKEDIITAVTGFPLCVLPDVKYSYEMRSLFGETVWYIDGRLSKEVEGRLSYRKVKLPFCKECKFFNVCEGILSEYIEIFGSEEFKPVAGKKIESVKELKRD